MMHYSDANMVKSFHTAVIIHRKLNDMSRACSSIILMVFSTIYTMDVRAAERPALVDHRSWQTSIKGQHGNNCFIYATVAALEAKLNREGYGALDLSEAFSDYMGAVFYLETCEFNGRFRTSTLRVPSSVERETSLAVDRQGTVESSTPCMRLSIPEEQYIPWNPVHHVPEGPADSSDSYWSNQFMVSTYNLNPIRLPRSALTAPRYYGIKSVQWLSREDASRPEVLEAVLAAGHDVIWDFKFGGDTQSFPWKFTVPADPMGAGHRMLLVGYDRRSRKQPYFIAKNSWGPTTNSGAGGFTYLNYDFIKYGEWAHYITSIHKPEAWSQLKAIGRWELQFGSKKGTLDIYHLPGLMGFEFEHNDYRDERGQRLEDRRLGMFYENGDPNRAYHVNGAVFKSQVRLWINFDQPTVRWDQMSGWKIELKAKDSGWSSLTGVARDTHQKSHPARAVLAVWPEQIIPTPQAGELQVPEFIQAEFRVVWEKEDGGQGLLGPAKGPIFRGKDGRWMQLFKRGQIVWDEQRGIDVRYE